MSRRNNEFKIGVTVFSFCIVIIWLIVTFGKQSLPHFAEEYSLYVNFKGVSGIDRNTPVNRNGVKIGRVDSIEPVDDAKESYIRVKLMIRKDRQIFSNDECRISSGLIGMGGNTHLEIVKRSDYDKETPVVPLGDGEPIPGAIPPNIMQSLSNMESKFNSAVQNFNDTAQKVGQFVDTVNNVVGTPETATENHDRILAILTRSGDMVARVDELVTNINQLFGDEKLRADLQKAAAQLPEIMDALSKDLPVITETLANDLPEISKVFSDKIPQAIDAIQKDVPTTLEQVRSTAENLETLTNEARVALNSITKAADSARTNLDNLETFTTALDADGPLILQSVRQASLKLDGVFNDITMLTTALRNPDGSLGQLVNNPELYQNVQKTIANAEEITASLKPILSDLRIFTDKISRDPGGTIGVRGAIAPGAAFKGLPSVNSRTRAGNRNEKEAPAILLGSEDLWYEQPRKSRGMASLIPQWNPNSPRTIVYENAPFGFRTETRSRNIFKNFRWNFWNKNKPQEIWSVGASPAFFGNAGASPALKCEKQVMEPRRLPKTARRLNRPQENPIVQVQHRVSQHEIPHQGVTQMDAPYMDDFTNSGHISSPGPVYGQNFEGFIHEGQGMHEGVVQNLHDELFQGEQNFNGRTYQGQIIYEGNSLGFGMPFGSGRTSSFFEEMRIRGIIFRESIKSFFYGLRGRFGGSNWFDSVETNPDGLFSYLRGNGGGATGLPWGKSDAYPRAFGSQNMILGSDQEYSHGSPSYSAHNYGSGYLGDGMTPVLDFSMPDATSGQFMPQGNIVQHEDFVPQGDWSGSFPPGTIFNPPSYSNGSNIKTIIPDAGNFPNGAVPEPSYDPGSFGTPQSQPANGRPTVAPAPQLDTPQHQQMPRNEHPAGPPPGSDQPGAEQPEGGQFGGPAPSFGSQFEPEGIPPTILDFAPPESEKQDAEAEDTVSGFHHGWGKTFPTKNRGYIIELETDVPQVASRSTSESAESVEPVATEIRLSFTAPARPAPVVSQASLQTAKPVDTTPEISEQESEEQPEPPQYGSVRLSL